MLFPSGSLATAANVGCVVLISVGFSLVPHGRGRVRLSLIGGRGALLKVMVILAVPAWNFFHCRRDSQLPLSSGAARPTVTYPAPLSAARCAMALIFWSAALGSSAKPISTAGRFQAVALALVR